MTRSTISSASAVTASVTTDASAASRVLPGWL
jgi:hypothetical protein